MDIKRLIPGILAILAIIIFFTGVYTSASEDLLITEDCNQCHQGNVPKASAIDAHANANMNADDCKECHESAEQAHLREDFVLTDCVHCHESDRGKAMAYTECDNCHIKDPHEDVPSEECETCHTNCNSCHNVEKTSIESGNHASLQCNGCHVYHLYVPDCTDCHVHQHEDRENANGYTTQNCIGCHGPVHPSSYSEIREGVIRT